MAFFAKLKENLKSVKERWSGGIASLFTGEPFDEFFWSELEERLILGDVGAVLSERIVEEMKREAKKRGVSTKSDLKSIFVSEIAGRLAAVEGMGQPFTVDDPPLVLLMVGVNGSGKTTSAGKLGTQFLRQGRQVILAAADTFRAAATEQLQIWGERAGVRVIAQKPGSDPAAVAFDAWQATRASSADVLIVDTAGRLHAKHNLMEELRKIHKVLEREAGADRIRTVLVLDAVTGQNGVAQASTFHRILPLSAVILSKYDNTAKGGIVLPIACDLKIPIRYIGLGEGIEDLSPFDPVEFAAALMEGDEENREENREKNRSGGDLK
ncbi:MAG: signal recognition particle-docking protein FtsY [Synergistaceae bacterium]|jgi:fused signal recognition particle receptor|nr:signal recognition particle-docking protein FtsY [Synergistaceae bacterium]